MRMMKMKLITEDDFEAVLTFEKLSSFIFLIGSILSVLLNFSHKMFTSPSFLRCCCLCVKSKLLFWILYLWKISQIPFAASPRNRKLSWFSLVTVSEYIWEPHHLLLTTKKCSQPWSRCTIFKWKPLSASIIVSHCFSEAKSGVLSTGNCQVYDPEV